MIKIGGVVYRNIQEQVAKNTQDIAKIQRKPVLQVKKVDELPEEGEEGILYLLPASDPETGNYFEEYLWIDSAWELIGSSAVDISNMVTTDTEQTITGIKKLAFNLNPATSSTYDLGSSSFKWKDIYLSGKIDIGSSGTTYINADAYNGIALNINNSTKFLVREGTTYINNNLYPLSDGTRDIGTNGAAFKDLYLKGNALIADTSSGESPELKLQNNVNTSRIRANGYSTDINTHWNPRNTSTYTLGTDQLKWKDLYLSGALKFSTYTYINETQSNLLFSSTTGHVMFNSNAVSWADGGFSLGTSTRKWKDLYLTGNISDGTNDVSIADLIALITYAKAQGWIS